MSQKAIEATNDHNLLFKQFSNTDRFLMTWFYDWSVDKDEDEKKQRCPCGLTLMDDGYSLECGKCEVCWKEDEQEQHETTCDFCSKKMAEDEVTGERCSGCEKWCCNTCDESLGYLEEDVKEKCALCSNCIESS
jgi:hypothetical protein